MVTRSEQLYSPGSYGVFPRVKNNGQRVDGQLPGTPIPLWFCGGRRAGEGMASVCAHSTRQEAYACPNRSTKN